MSKVSKDDIHKWQDWPIMASHADSAGVLTDARFSNVVKFGYNLDVDSGAEETIWPMGGTWSPTSGAETVEIVSSSSNDTNSSGTGARLVAVFGLDTDYNEVSELTLALNGTTAITTTNQYRYINRIAVALSGSSNYNEGVITATQQTSGAVLAQIPAQTSITQQAVYTVPAGHSAYLQGILFNGVKSTGGSVPLITYKVYSYNEASATSYLVQETIEDASAGNTIFIPYPFANLTAEKNTIYVNAETDSNNTRVFCRFFMRLVNNSEDYT